MLDSYERDRAKARNVGIVGDKAVSAVRRLECDAQASFCHDRVKVASNWVPCLTAGARLCTFSAPEDLPNSVSQEVSLLVAGVAFERQSQRVVAVWLPPGLYALRHTL